MIMAGNHGFSACPGVGYCGHSWHDGGCDPHWQYADESGYVISGGQYDEQDAMRKTLWSGPDGPDEIWIRPRAGDSWVRES
jgi:hypothetical protein